MSTKKNTTALAGSALQLLDVDPATLGVDDQVRADATPSDDLVESVLRMGVLQPPTVYWDTEREQHIVVIGHRRVGAAIAAKLKSIQVLVRDAAEAKDALRLEQQLVENERRQSLTPADVARGYADLQLFGMRPEDIAAAVAERPARVKAALTATKSEAATEALDRGIDLEQAAIIADFDDEPATQKRLTTTAIDSPAEFARSVETARRERTARERRDVAAAQLEREGVPLVQTIGWDARHWSGDGTKIPHGQGRVLDDLDITMTEHRYCPGHAAIIHNAFNPEAVALAYVCTDWKGNDHELKSVIREYSPEERELQEQREKEREAERQIEAAFTANSTARREWLRGFILGRLNQTAGLFDLIADATVGAVEHDQNNDIHNNEHIAVYILTGEEVPRHWNSTHLADMLKDGRVTALRALAADALATAEAWTTRPGVAKFSPRLVLAYFNHLTTWGYELTELDHEIEAAAADTLAADAIDAAGTVGDDEGEEDDAA